MKTAKHECSSLNFGVRVAWGILFAFAISIIDSQRMFAQEVKGTESIVSSQSTSISQAEVERINVFLKFLASNNAQERIIAIKVLESLALRKQFPPEFVPVLVHIYDTDKDSIVVQAAAGVLFMVVDSDTAFAKGIIPRVSVHIQSEAQRKIANRIVDLLKREGYVSEIVKRAPWEGEDLWLYLSTLNSDLLESDKIIGFFEGYNLKINQWDNSAAEYYLTRVRPRHFELWLPLSLTILKEK